MNMVYQFNDRDVDDQILWDPDIEELLSEIEDSNQEFFDNEWDKFIKTPNEIIESEKTDLGIVQLYIPSSYDDQTDPYIINSYTYISSIVPYGFINIYDYYVNNQLQHYKKHLYELSDIIHDNTHPNIRNYKKIILNYNPTVEIIKRVYYKGYTLAIIKTCWLRIFQKKFRNRQKKKRNFIRNINNIHYRELHGKWPNEYYMI